MAGPVIFHDPDAERAVLSACLHSRLAHDEARKHLTGKDFYEPTHEFIWDSMGRLQRAGKQVEPVAVMGLVRNDRQAVAMMPDLVTTASVPTHVGQYAEIVRAWALKRRLANFARRIEQHALSAETNPTGLAAKVATEAAAIRDYGATDDTTAVTLGELLEQEDDAPNWLIPDLLERRDRLILTGDEGLGKSVVLRQLAVLAAAGMDPWGDTSKHFAPISVVIIDCENTWSQVRRKVRPLFGYAARYGQDPRDRVLLDCCRRMDITTDRDLARIHRLLDAAQPDLVVIGPLYRLVPRALQTDDEAGPVLAALDTIRDRGAALLMEAHAGHAMGVGGRNMRPRGSSALLGWPEFGMGMRACDEEGLCDLLPWRGNREERHWPKRLSRVADAYRWQPDEDPRRGGWAA